MRRGTLRGESESAVYHSPGALLGQGFFVFLPRKIFPLKHSSFEGEPSGTRGVRDRDVVLVGFCSSGWMG